MKNTKVLLCGTEIITFMVTEVFYGTLPKFEVFSNNIMFKRRELCDFNSTLYKSQYTNVFRHL